MSQVDLSKSPVVLSKKHIVLIGFMGSGKSTVGQALAIKIGWRFVDLDEAIEKEVKQSVSDFFVEKGEASFRKVESVMLQSFLNQEEKTVIAVGGGTPLFYEGIDHINQYATSIYLKLGIKPLMHRLQLDTNRPLLKSKNGTELLSLIIDLLNQRKIIYQKADFTIMGNRSVEAIVKRICSLVLNLHLS